MNSNPTLLVAALAVTSSLALGQSFSLGATVSAPVSPGATAVGDVNRDGAPDLVVCGGWNNDVTVVLGTKAASPILGRVLRSFAAPTAFAVGGAYPHDVILVDINGDKLLDIVTANRDSNDLSILAGNGLGGFAAAIQIPVGTSPHTVRSNAFNNDDFPDLVVSNQGSSNITVVLGNGAIGMGAATNYAVAGTPMGLTFGDFDRNGAMDLAVAGRDSNAVDVLLNVGAGGFGTATSYPTQRPDDVCCEDFDGDGLLDLVTADSRGQISFLEGDGAGAFTARLNFGTLGGGLAQRIRCADLDLDGAIDVVVASGNDTVSMLINNGDGSFARAVNVSAGIGASVVDVLIHDVDTDGNLDLVVTSQFSWDARVLYNDATFPTGIDGYPNTPYGDGHQGTPGCSGYLGIRSTTALRGTTFALEVTGAPADATGLLLLGGPPSRLGIAPFNSLGINVNIGPGLIDTQLMDSNLVGVGRVQTTVPTIPPLAGAIFYLQSAWIEKPGVSQCSRSSIGVVTSRILKVTIQ